MTPDSPLGSLPHDVMQAIVPLMTTQASQIERATGCVRRTSAMSGGRLVQTLVFGWLSNPQASLEQLSHTAARCGAKISPQGLDQRFTPAASAYLKQVLEAGIRQRLHVTSETHSILSRFSAVTIQDSTVIGLPDELSEVWRGCRGRGGEAAMKVQLKYDLKSGHILDLELQDGRTQDRAARVQHIGLQAQALRLADLGYFSLDVLHAHVQADSYFLCRPQSNTCVWQASRCVHLEAILASVPEQQSEIDWPIDLGKTERIACRLLARRVPPEVAQARRRRLKRAARQKGYTPSAGALSLCDWHLLVTNVPPDRLSLDEAFRVARCRWQIELIFKLWKSVGWVDEWRTHKTWRILCEVYAKLLAMLIQHWLFIVGIWARLDKSLRKAASVVQSFALELAAALLDPPHFQHVVATLQTVLATTCRISKRKRQPAHFQLIAEIECA
jgi:Transposase DDE domain